MVGLCVRSRVASVPNGGGDRIVSVAVTVVSEKSKRA
jgi:hypothetical protein